MKGKQEVDAVEERGEDGGGEPEGETEQGGEEVERVVENSQESFPVSVSFQTKDYILCFYYDTESLVHE